jgi:hypothetical protein
LIGLLGSLLIATVANGEEPASQLGSVDSKAYIDNELDLLSNWRFIEKPERELKRNCSLEEVS